MKKEGKKVIWKLIFYKKSQFFILMAFHFIIDLWIVFRHPLLDVWKAVWQFQILNPIKKIMREGEKKDNVSFFGATVVSLPLLAFREY